MTILKSDKIDQDTKNITRHKENYFIMINRLRLELLWGRHNNVNVYYMYVIL